MDLAEEDRVGQDLADLPTAEGAAAHGPSVEAVRKGTFVPSASSCVASSRTLPMVRYRRIS
jgi:hypothetical protein